MAKTQFAPLLIFILLSVTPCLCSQDEHQSEQQPFLSQDHQQQMMQQLSMKRTACLVLSRYHTSTQKEQIQQIMRSLTPEDQNKYINKLYAIAIEHCMPKISIQEAQQFFVEQAQFDPSSMFYILDTMSYAEVANDLDQDFTPNQKNLIKFIKNFDEQMQVRKQQKQAQKQSSSDDDQFTIFGIIPVKKFNSMAGIVYIVIISVVTIGALVWGFQQLNNSSLPKNKKKKSKSAKKQ